MDAVVDHGEPLMDPSTRGRWWIGPAVSVLITLTWASPSAGVVQPQWTEAEERENALRIIVELRSSVAATDVLRQVNHRRSVEVLDAFADRLMAIASEPVPETFQSRSGAVHAIGVRSAASVALAHAAQAEGGGIPYPWAFERLVRIYESLDGRQSGGVLYLMTELPRKDPVIEYFAEMAKSGVVGASSAMDHLAERLGEAGRARLKTLWERNEVHDPHLSIKLADIARRRGWGG